MRQGDDPFFISREWQLIRYRVLRRYGFKCMSCGAGKDQGAILQVDHVKPRSRYPELALSEDNLQVLCMTCNMGKSNIYEDDLRPLPPVISVKRIAKRPEHVDPAIWEERERARRWARVSGRIKNRLAKAEIEGNIEAQSWLMQRYLRIQRHLKEYNQYVA